MFNHAPKNYKCPFCGIARDNFDGIESRKEDVFYQDDYVTAFVSSRTWPNNQGNVIIVPNDHVESLYDMSDELLEKVHVLSRGVAIGLKKTYKCDGVSVRQHNEPDGNQDVWHYHLHVFPRWRGDDLYLKHREKQKQTDGAKYARKLRKYFEDRK